MMAKECVKYLETSDSTILRLFGRPEITALKGSSYSCLDRKKQIKKFFEKEIIEQTIMFWRED